MEDARIRRKWRTKNIKMLNIFIYYLGLGIERTERSRTIPSFRKKNKHIERVLKIVGTICKGTERTFLKRSFKSGTWSYYQERVLSRDCILNQECVLNHLEIIKSFFWRNIHCPAQKLYMLILLILNLKQITYYKIVIFYFFNKLFLQNSKVNRSSAPPPIFLTKNGTGDGNVLD